jgi:hypothetical protein
MKHTTVIRAALITAALMTGVGIPPKLCAQGSTDNWLVKFYAWSCRTVSFGCWRTAGLITAPRAGTDLRPRHGTLMAMDFKTRKTRTLWADCDCWSPVPLRPGVIALITGAGIVELSLDAPSKHRQMFAGTGVRELLGVELTRDRTLLFLRASQTSGCEFEPWQLDPSQVAAQPVSASDLPCGSGLDFLSLVKPSQNLADRLLITTRSRGLLDISVQSQERLEPLLPADETSNRFDAVWSSPTTIVFVTGPM